MITIIIGAACRAIGMPIDRQLKRETTDRPRREYWQVALTFFLIALFIYGLYKGVQLTSF